MRVLALALTLALLGATTTTAQESSVALQKLEQLRSQRRDLANRNRVAIVFVNETPIAGAEQSLIEEAGILFSQKGYEIVNQEAVNKAVAAHPKNAPWTNDELRSLADQLGVETIVIGNLKEYKAKKRFGLPLPTMWVRTDADVTVDGAVYRRSQDQVVWKDSFHKKKKQLIGGGLVHRDDQRRTTSWLVVDALYKGYLNRRS